MKRRKLTVEEAAPARKRADSSYHYDILKHGVTQGFFEKLIGCPMRAQLAVEEGWSSVQFKGAMAFGNAVHFGLDHAYTTFRDTRRADLAIVSVPGALAAHQFTQKKQLEKTPLWSPDTLQEIEEIHAIAEILLRHYFLRNEHDFRDMEWIELEQNFSIPYLLPGMTKSMSIPLRGKVDGIFRQKKTRRLRVLETKTKGQIEEGSMERRLVLDFQSLFYLTAVRHLYGEIPQGILYNVMRRPGLRRGKAESLREFLDRIDSDIEKRPDFYFLRFDVDFTSQDFKVFDQELEALVRYAYEWSQGRHRFRFSPSCETKYGTCEFLNVCSRGDYTYLRRKEDVYPELVTVEELLKRDT